MGVDGLWPWMATKGYSPSKIILGFTKLPVHGRKRRVDLAGGYYPTLRWAYGSNTMDKAHVAVERELRRLGNQNDIVIYIDGTPPVEKRKTHAERAERRAKALDKAENAISELYHRINSDQHVTKAHFDTADRHLAGSFLWAPEAKESLAKYLRRNKWEVIECDMEADVQIARECQPDDIVVSRDSDFLGYSTVKTIWRLMGKSHILEYNVDSLLAASKLTRAQLTVLCIVSHNDYSDNLYGLGSETNYKIVKNLQEQDIQLMVQAYLSDNRVVRANTDRQESFEAATRVFHHHQQTRQSISASATASASSLENASPETPSICYPSTPDAGPACPLLLEPLPDSPHPHQSMPTNTAGSAKRKITYSSMRGKFDLLREQQNLRKKQFWKAKLSNKNLPGTWKPTHKPTQKYNRYRTAPPRHGKNRGANQIKHRPPYSFKSRTQRAEHGLPPAMVQLKWKGYKELSKQEKPSTVVKNKTPIQPPITSITKKSLLSALAFEHPTVCQPIGCLQGKINKVLTDMPTLRMEVLDCIRHAVRLAWAVKCLCQQIIGLFLETLFSSDTDIDASDREMLDALCERISAKTLAKEDGQDASDGDDQTDLGGKGSKQLQFLKSFMTYLFSGALPGTKGGKGKESGVVGTVNTFITRLNSLGLLEQVPLSDTASGMVYTPSNLVRSVASQVKVEIKKHYRNGTKTLLEKLKKQQEQGTLSKEISLEIHLQKSAIENFIRLRRLTQNSWTICPLSPVQIGYVNFSEPELASFFWYRPSLNAKLQEMAAALFNNPPANGLALVDVQSSLPVGHVIKSFIADVDPEGLSVRKRGKLGFLGTTWLWPPHKILGHVNSLRNNAFDPAAYHTKGYLLRGSIRTDGHKVQLLAFKLRELQSVRYRRYPEAKLPPRLQSTVGGVDYYLSEIRNVIQSPEDIVRIFGCPGNILKILALDLGQACIIGASLLLPESEPHNGMQNPEVFHNQAVKTKAVMQPIFKLRRWMNAQKDRPLDGPTEDTHVDSLPAQPHTIKWIESTLPPLRGTEASVSSHIKHRDKHYEALNNFYNGNNYQFKKHTWDAERAKQEEYAKVANELLKAVGGSIGAKKADNNHVVIAIGLSKFQTKAGLASLDGTFSKYFIQLARSLGYIVIGINEFYTSQKCPKCENFIGRITLRRLHCRHCRRRYHRDAMAAANMCNIVRSYLSGNGRPRYLQPVRADGTYPWEEQTGVSSVSNDRSGRGDSANGGTVGTASSNSNKSGNSDKSSNSSKSSKSSNSSNNSSSTTGSGKRKAASKGSRSRKKAAPTKPALPMNQALLTTRVMDNNDDETGSSLSQVAIAFTPATTKRKTTNQGPGRATKKPARRVETTVVGSGHESTSTNTQSTTSSTTKNGNSRKMVSKSAKSSKPHAMAQHRTRPATIAARSSETKEPSHHAHKTTVDVFSAPGSDAMDEYASVASNLAGGPVVQASVNPSPAVAEASAC
ncbi:Elongation of fatty acids protein 2 [Podila clonocystis]|nr:Elongation of fatty acids protein 2 [Podila clonocystis]